LAQAAFYKQVENWAKDLAAIYIYFDNDQAGYAARNALGLKRKVNVNNSHVDQGGYQPPRERFCNRFSGLRIN